MQLENEIATWIGRRQAFGLMASKLSVADASCLKYLRETKEYKAAGMSWEDFCTRHIGITRSRADRIISQLDEFGAAYFALSEIVHIPAEAFREIASAVSEHSIEYNGQTIPIKKENGRKIAEVIRTLREEAAQSRREAPVTDAPPRVDPVLLKALRRRLDRALEVLTALALSSLHPADRAEVAGLVGAARARLEQLRDQNNAG